MYGAYRRPAVRRKRRAPSRKPYGRRRTVRRPAYRRRRRTVGSYKRSTLRVRGRGSYSAGKRIRSNDLIRGGVKSTPTLRTRSDETGALTITNTEYLGEFYAKAGDFSVLSYELNPGLERTFPWLSQLSQNYEEYEIQQLIFKFRSTLSQEIDGTSGQVGTLIAATQYNCHNPIFADKAAMLQYAHTVSNKSTSNLQVGVECDPRKLSGSRIKNIRATALEPKHDIEDYDHGRLEIAQHNVPTKLNGASLGELHVYYKIKLLKPKIATGRAVGLNTTQFSTTAALVPQLNTKIDQITGIDGSQVFDVNGADRTAYLRDVSIQKHIGLSCNWTHGKEDNMVTGAHRALKNWKPSTKLMKDSIHLELIPGNVIRHTQESFSPDGTVLTKEKVDTYEYARDIDQICSAVNNTENQLYEFKEVDLQGNIGADRTGYLASDDVNYEVHIPHPTKLGNRYEKDEWLSHYACSSQFNRTTTRVVDGLQQPWRTTTGVTGQNSVGQLVESTKSCINGSTIVKFPPTFTGRVELRFDLYGPAVMLPNSQFSGDINVNSVPYMAEPKFWMTGQVAPIIDMKTPAKFHDFSIDHPRTANLDWCKFSADQAVAFPMSDAALSTDYYYAPVYGDDPTTPLTYARTANQTQIPQHVAILTTNQVGVSCRPDGNLIQMSTVKDTVCGSITVHLDVKQAVGQVPNLFQIMFPYMYNSTDVDVRGTVTCTEYNTAVSSGQPVVLKANEHADMFSMTVNKEQKYLVMDPTMINPTDQTLNDVGMLYDYSPY